MRLVLGKTMLSYKNCGGWLGGVFLVIAFTINLSNVGRNDFNVTVPETDKIVELSTQVRGVFGARMTGGGFGGTFPVKGL